MECAISRQIDRHLAHEDYCRTRDAYIGEHPEFAFVWSGSTPDEWAWTEQEVATLELVRAFAASDFQPLLASDGWKIWRDNTAGLTVEQVVQAASDDKLNTEWLVELALFSPPSAMRTWCNKRLIDAATELRERAAEWLLNNERVLRSYDDAQEAEGCPEC